MSTSDRVSEVEFCETIDELNNCGIVPFFTFKGEKHLAKVVKCYDGDTIHCTFKHNGCYNTFKIRMFGYDTAEMRPSRSLSSDVRDEIKKRALDAKNRLSELILNKIVVLDIVGEGKYSRLLGIVKLNDNDESTINDIMVQEGHGKPYFGGSKD